MQEVLDYLDLKNHLDFFFDFLVFDFLFEGFAFSDKSLPAQQLAEQLPFVDIIS